MKFLMLKKYAVFEAIQLSPTTARQDEPLLPIIDGRNPQAQFCQRVLARVLHYAAGLVPDVTTNPQDIDDAMILGSLFKS